MQRARDDILAGMRHILGNVPGRGGAACLLSGSAGMGKTHLAERFLRQLPTGTAALVGSVPPTGAPPLLPICRAFASDATERVAYDVSSTIFEYSQSVPILKETLGPLLKLHRERRRSGALPGDIAPNETHTFFVLSEILRRVSARAATVLFIDDVQWLDASSVAFLGFLLDELARVPVFVLLSARTNGTEPSALVSLREALSRHEACVTSFSLPELSVEEAVRVAGRCLEGSFDCSPGEADWLRKTSKGSPKYLKEVVALLRERAALVRVAGVWRFAGPPECLVLPPSLRATTLARLEPIVSALPEADVLLSLAAVSGRRFDAREIAGPAGVTVPRAMSILGRLAAATGLISRLGATAAWEFDHDLTREAILDRVGELARDLHVQMAEVLGVRGKTHPIVIANHYRDAQAWLPAATYYARAAEQGIRTFTFADAAAAARENEAMLIRAGTPFDSGERLVAAELVGRCLVGSGAHADASRYLAGFCRLAHRERRPKLLHMLARAKLNLASAESHAEALELLKEAAEQHDGAGDPETALSIWTELILAHDALGNRAASQAAFRRAFAIARSAASELWTVRLLRLTCVFWQPEKVIEATEKALALARKGRFTSEQAFCLNNLGTQLWYLRDLDRAEQRFDSARNLLTSCGGYRRDVPTNNLGLVALARGQLGEAIMFFEAALEGSLTPNDRLLIRTNAAVAECMAGDVDDGLCALRHLAEEADAAGDVFHRDCVRHNLARALLLADQPGAALRELTASPPRHFTTDDDLILAKRAALLAEAGAALGHGHDDAGSAERRLLATTTKPQAWLYRYEWELCDIQFWQD